MRREDGLGPHPARWRGGAERAGGRAGRRTGGAPTEARRALWCLALRGTVCFGGGRRGSGAGRLRGRKQRSLLGVLVRGPADHGDSGQSQVGRRVVTERSRRVEKLSYLSGFVLGFLYSLLLVEQKGSVHFRFSN